MSHHLFTYGTLMCADIFRAVAGQALESVPATLAGFARHPVRGAHYPGIVAAPGHSVTGRVYRGLSTAALARLDRFEGALYRRQRVTLTTPAQPALIAWAYVVPRTHAHRLAPGAWDFDRFIVTAKARFLRSDPNGSL